MAEKNFLLVGGNFINKGAEAMLKAVQYQILNYYPGANIYVICSYTQQDPAREQGFIPVFKNSGGIKAFIENTYSKVRTKVRKKLSMKTIPFADETPLKDMRRKVKQLDMALDVSGFAYHDGRGYRQPVETIKVMDFCRKLDAPYIFMPQAWGSFRKEEVATNVKAMLQKAGAFYVRDHVSQEHIANLLKIPVSEVPVYPDIAFSFPKPDLAVGEKILTAAGRTSAKRQLLAIAPNMRVYWRVKHRGLENLYIQKLQRIAEHAINHGMDLILVPNEIFPEQDYEWDDRHICRILMNAINQPSRCFSINDYRSATEIKSVIGNADFLVGSRFHSLIFALSQGIPCLAISWSHKYRELFRLFDMEKFVVEDSELKNDPTIDLLNELVRDGEKWSVHIEGVLPEIRKKLQTPFKHLSEEV